MKQRLISCMETSRLHPNPKWKGNENEMTWHDPTINSTAAFDCWSLRPMVRQERQWDRDDRRSEARVPSEWLPLKEEPPYLFHLPLVLFHFLFKPHTERHSPVIGHWSLVIGHWSADSDSWLGRILGTWSFSFESFLVFNLERCCEKWETSKPFVDEFIATNNTEKGVQKKKGSAAEKWGVAAGNENKTMSDDVRFTFCWCRATSATNLIYWLISDLIIFTIHSTSFPRYYWNVIKSIHFDSETFQFGNISILKHFNSETFQFGNISILKHFNSHLRPQEAARMQQRQDLPVWIVWVSSSRAWRRPRRHPTRPSNFHISGNNIWRRRKKKQIIFTMTNFSRVLQLFWRGFFTCKYIELFWELCDCNTIDIVVNTNIEIELEFHPRLISMHCCHADDTAIQLGSNRNQVNWSK